MTVSKLWRRSRASVIAWALFGATAPALHLHPVGGSQIGNHKSGSGIDDYGMVAADLGVVENDVIVRKAPYPCGRRLFSLASDAAPHPCIGRDSCYSTV
jgi:hypothetical protein